MTAPDPAKPRQTPLRAVHERLGASMTEFAGWLMPLRYRSETAEHQAVRGHAGLFDLSHMGEIIVAGPGAAAALDYALVGQPSSMAPGRARYTMICAADGGVLDDLIVYRLADQEFLVVANAANTGVVDSALRERADGHDAQITDQTDAYALIAIQGPAAAGILGPLTDIALDGVKYYTSHRGTVAGREILLARTGYTGEDGFELFSQPGGRGAHLDDAVRGGRRRGPGARGARRPGHAPAGGRDAAVRQRTRAGHHALRRRSGPGGQAGQARRFRRPGRARRGGAGRPRAGSWSACAAAPGASPGTDIPVLWDGQPRGAVTSGAPSPTLGVPIAMAYVEPEVAAAAGDGDAGPGGGDAADGRLAVDVRGRAEPAQMTPLPFYRRTHNRTHNRP